MAAKYYMIGDTFTDQTMPDSRAYVSNKIFGLKLATPKAQVTHRRVSDPKGEHKNLIVGSKTWNERFLEYEWNGHEFCDKRSRPLPEFMNTVEKAMYSVNRVDSPYLQVYPDIGNISNATSDVPADIRTGKGHIAAAHLKETVPGKFREIPYGTGQVDFPAAIAQLYRQGVRRYVAEFWYCGEDNWREIAAWNRKFLDEQFAKAAKLL